MATEQERNRGLGAYSTPGVDVKPDLSPAQIITGAPEVTFAHKNLAPPSQVYINRDDQLKINVYNSQPNITINITYRILRFDGVVVPNFQTVAPTSNRVRNAFQFLLTEGFLLSVQVFSEPPALIRGQTFVYLEIGRQVGASFTGYWTLLQDYLAAGQSLSWPGSRIIQSIEGPGWTHSVAVTQPAAGADWTVTIPTNARWRFMSGAAQLVTSAAVANRVTEFNPNDSVPATMGIGTPNQTVPASQTVQICYSPSVPTAVANITDVVCLATPVVSLAGYVLKSRSTNLQAADQYSNVNLEVEEWIETT